MKRTKAKQANVEKLATWVENIGDRLHRGGMQSMSDSTYKYFADEIRCEFGNGHKCIDCQNLECEHYTCAAGVPGEHMPDEPIPEGCEKFKWRKDRKRTPGGLMPRERARKCEMDRK